MRWKKIQQEDGKEVHIQYYSDCDLYGENMATSLKQKILQIIKLDVEYYHEEPLNWDWKDPEDWDNAKKAVESIGREKFNQLYRQIVGEDKDNKEKKDRFSAEVLKRSKHPWYENYYDKKKPNFTFERIGLTFDQVTDLELTDLTSYHSLTY